MAQFARPDADITDGNWTAEGGPTDLFDCINESSPSDTDFMEDAGNDTTAEVGLTTIVDPVTPSNHIIRFRIQGNGSGGPERCNLQLFQGVTEIAATGNQTSRGAWDTKEYTLSDVEADSIDDYSDLRFKIVSSNLGGSETMWCSWAELEVPDEPPEGGSIPVVMNQYRRRRAS